MTASAIKPLPIEAQKQLKSSVALNSLNDAVVGLVKNSLDAQAGTIQVEVDLPKGSCCVEDDGSGIAASEFGESGGLGMMHYTSKFTTANEFHGRYGRFLASLSALSLLSISSRQPSVQRESHILYHHSQVLTRQLGVPETDQSFRRKNGTRVVVRDLFGNIAVRAKQRAVRFAITDNIESELRRLKLQIVAVALAWGKPVRIVVSDQQSQRKQRFALGAHARGRTNGQQAAKGSPRTSAFQLDHICTILSHAGCITPSDFGSWTTLSARTSQMFIRAAVCLEPAPSKQVQFVSLGIHPLEPSSTLSHVLYREINSLFAESAFGIIEDDIGLSEEESLRRLKDRRYKTDGHTERQLKAKGKGVDRWPMFYIRIDPRETDLPVNALGSDEDDRQAAKFLEKTVQLIRSVMQQFLHEHHFRPRGKRHRNNVKSLQKNLTANTPASEPLAERRSAAESAINGSKTSIAHTIKPKLASANDFAGRQDEKLPNLPPPVAFGSWSRIKTGKPRALEDLLAGLPRSKSTGTLQCSSTDEKSDEKDLCYLTKSRTREESLTETEWNPDVELLLGELNQLSDTEIDNQQSGIEQNEVVETETTGPSHNEESSRMEPRDFEDDILVWKNPTSGKSVRINARTGLPMPDLPPRPRSEPHASTSDHRSRLSSNIRGFMRQRTNTPCWPDLPEELRTRSDSWLANLLNGWQNPVFHSKERPIPSVVDEAANEISTQSRNCYDVNRSHSSESRAAEHDQRLSKASLAAAHILGQVDHKFILAKMSTSRSGTMSYTPSDHHDDVLVLIDQHAADERCRVEDLYYEVSKSNAARVALPRPIIFEITAQELEHFGREQQYFESWGIMYKCRAEQDAAKENAEAARPVSARLSPVKSLVDQCGIRRPASAVASTTSSTFAKSESTRKSRPLIVVHALPELIVERCRLDPKLLIDILRSEVWARTEATRRASALPPTGKDIPTDEGEAPTYSWLQRISDCPRGILELINSRACRSAIMFNDEMTMTEAAELVKTLVSCAFPFQCAHGRPTMVVLGGLVGEAIGTMKPSCQISEEYGSTTKEGNNQTFIQAFQAWQQRDGASMD